MANIMQLNKDFLLENNKFITDLITELKIIIENINNTLMNKDSIIEKIKKLIELGNNAISTNKNKFDSLINGYNQLNINKMQDYPDGKYIGEFKNGLREGKGIFYYNDGARYEGDYRNDKREGKGIYYFSNGE